MYVTVTTPDVPFGLTGTFTTLTKPFTVPSCPVGPTAVDVAEMNSVVGVVLIAPVLVSPVRAPSSVTVTTPDTTAIGCVHVPIWMSRV